MEVSLNEVLKDFGKNDGPSSLLTENITIPVTKDTKARYDALQRNNKRSFCGKVREILVKTIELAESQTS